MWISVKVLRIMWMSVKGIKDYVDMSTKVLRIMWISVKSVWDSLESEQSAWD
jgi:hypothetical protein